MLHTTNTNKVAQNEKAKEAVFLIFLGVVLFTWTTGGLGLNIPAQFTEYLIGGSLIALNLYRYANNIEMGKFSFMFGSFIIAHAFLSSATLYNPIIFPLFGLMMAALGIFNILQNRITK